ncbi:MAG: peptidoglycan DD-metalloendopeptidase family protein [Syntrophothermus sp.]
MKHILLVLFLLTLLANGYSQKNKAAIIDTVITEKGPVVLYKNNSWEYLQDEPVMMSQEDDSTGVFNEGWLNDQVFGFRGMIKKDSVKDTAIVLTCNGRKFTLPVYGHLFRGFMYTHKGLDIHLSKGDTVKAAFDGVVRYAKYNRGGFGNLVIIRHYNGLETYYAHLSALKVSVNQVIKSGDLVGLGGSTGRSRSPHLHFEVRYKDVPMDPLKMIDLENKSLIANTFPITRSVFYPSNFNTAAVYHTIRSGDTIGRIAKKYRTSVKELCAINKIKPGTRLRIGRSIRVK